MLVILDQTGGLLLFVGPEHTRLILEVQAVCRVPMPQRHLPAAYCRQIVYVILDTQARLGVRV